MSPLQIETLRDAISTGMVGYSDICASIAEASKSLSIAMAEEDFEGIELQARYIADVSSWLQKNREGVSI